MWEWHPATTIAAGCRSHQKAKHIGAQLPWKQAMARGAIICGTKSPRPPLPKGERRRRPLALPFPMGETPGSSYSPFNKGGGGILESTWRRWLYRQQGAEKRRLGLSAKAHGLLESAAYRKICEHFQGAVQRRITARGAVFLRVEEIGRCARGQRRHQVLGCQHCHGVARGCR